jgi:hypothetical protein
MSKKYKNHAKGTFEVKSWDEKTWEGKPWNEASGARLTHAKVTQSFQGDIEGEGTMQSLMSVRDDNFASFTGMQQIVGQVGDRSGSFILQFSGTFEDGAAKTTWFVTPGSGTGELQGLRGEGEYIARHGEQQVPFTLDYDFE